MVRQRIANPLHVGSNPILTSGALPRTSVSLGFRPSVTHPTLTPGGLAAWALLLAVACNPSKDQTVAAEAAAAPVVSSSPPEVVSGPPAPVPPMVPGVQAHGLPQPRPGGGPPVPSMDGGLAGVLPPGFPTSLPGIPSVFPTTLPPGFPTALPSGLPTALPSGLPIALPSGLPTALPTAIPSNWPSALPSAKPAPK